MAVTTKPNPQTNSGNAIVASYNEVDKSLAVSGFLTAAIGRKITQTITTTTVANDTEEISFYDGATLLYTLEIIYTDGNRTVMLSAERTA